MHYHYSIVTSYTYYFSFYYYFIIIIIIIIIILTLISILQSCSVKQWNLSNANEPQPHNIMLAIMVQLLTYMQSQLEKYIPRRYEQIKLSIMTNIPVKACLSWESYKVLV